MNKRAPLILLIVISILLAFTYRFLSSSGKISDPKDEKLYPLTQDQVEWLAKKKELIIAFSDDSSPFITLTPKGGAEGILVDYIGLISSGYDIDVKYISILENDAGQVLNDGIADAALLRHSTELEKDVIFTMPLIKAKGILMFSNDLSLDNSNGGKGYIVSVSGKDPSIDYLHKKFPQMTLLPAKDTEGAVDLLKSGKANSIAGSEAALNYFLDRNYVADNLIKAEGYTFEKNYCLGLAKKNDELYGILNNAIYHMDSVHTITSLQSKWMGVSYTLYRENIIAKIGVIALILLASVLGVFIVFYQSNKSLYEELQQRMELLIESQNEMQTTFDGVSYYLVEVNREGRIIDINKALSQYLKIRRSDAIGLRFTDTFGANSEVTDKLSELIEETFSKDAGRNLEFLVGKGIFEAHSFTVKDTRRKIRKVLLMIEDVTDQRSAERQMLQDNKMIAIGQLAAGVAHEIRNPLGLIRNYCYVLKNIDHDDDETRNEAIKVIEKSVDKSGKIIENLLEFSRITTNK
ncbi:MAG TPA: transporter substrate-binding domain-containing protein, partial [Anaerovoracaceae bacterium]|nr:transporter substrate-binding domain-containing protein [Anaerovoracaceae bacterium]